VDVDGVGVFGEIEQLPDLDGVERRGFRDRVVPAQVDRGPIAVQPAQERGARPDPVEDG